jgi:uncharacterized protein
MIEMIKKTTLLLFAVFFTAVSYSQTKSYPDSLKLFIENYVNTHGVVKGTDRKYLQFFPINEKYRIESQFEKIENSPWFMMETSGLVKKSHRIYGKIHFAANDTALCIYQSQDLRKTKEYKDYLFIPFIDASAGEETYESGRYIDLTIEDIKSNTCVVDFNKAYNPYCAYVSNVYNCPVPPKDNWISVSILAGEKKYVKSH